MITAAEKFDKIPPWCVVKNDLPRGWCIRDAVTPPNGFSKFADKCGTWASGEWIDTESKARRIARLTRPPDSWEPAEDCPLPVDGWTVVQDTTGRWFVHASTAADQPIAPRFPDRRAAYEWAWREAPAPQDATDPAERKPITEADVKAGDPKYPVGSMWRDALDNIRTITESGWKISGCYNSPAEFPDVWAARHTWTLITDGTGATDGLEARVAKVEGVLARICPEADSQTDGKGRTLVQIDREISDLCEIAQVTARRVTNLERLSAAQVPVPAKVHVRSDAASTVEAMTEAAAVDEGWREMLVPVSFTHEDSLMWWMTPDRKAYTGHCLNPSTDWGTFDSTLRDFVVVTDNRKDDPVYLAVRSKIAPPPNLAEWYKPGAKVSKPDEALVMSVEAHRATCDKIRELHAFVKSLLPRVCECCRESIKAALGKADIPDDVLKL